jgi:hypothetical protein
MPWEMMVDSNATTGFPLARQPCISSVMWRSRRSTSSPPPCPLSVVMEDKCDREEKDADPAGVILFV